MSDGQTLVLIECPVCGVKAGRCVDEYGEHLKIGQVHLGRLKQAGGVDCLPCERLKDKS